MTQLQTYLLLLALTVSRVVSFITSTAYQLQDDYQISSFQSYFDFFTDSDPTGGYVDYIDLPTAQSVDLFSIRSNQVFIGVDNTTIPANSQRGRRSVRLQSKTSYNHGLFILDLAHMPGGQCGTWPAFWMISTTKPWPYGGEVDIIEGVNSQTGNSMTMHTNSGCVVTRNVNLLESSVFKTINCDIHAQGQDENQGCNINNIDKSTYGTAFNAIGGGIYATEWNSDHIAMWYFPRASIPADITAGNPVPGSWGLPIAVFQGNGQCDIDQHFVDQQIIFDITFCGQWAGQVWPTDTICHTLAKTCTNYVQNNPSAFTDTYWLVNSLKVYKANGYSPPSNTTTTPSSPSTTTAPTNITSTSTMSTTSMSTSTSSMSSMSATTSSMTSTSTNTTSTTNVPTTTTSMMTTMSITTTPILITSTVTTPMAIVTSTSTTSMTTTLMATTLITTTSTTSTSTRTTTTTLVAPITTSGSQSFTLSPRLSSTSSSTTVSWTQPASQSWPTATGGWNHGSWWGWQSQARFAPTGGWRQNYWGPP